MASIHEKLERVRRPRVHITYSVETEGAQVEKELPFVVGVMGDFSGNPTKPLPSLKERKFVQIDRDNFDDVLAKFAPELHFAVKNTLKKDGPDLKVDLKFHSMEDFNPERVVDQVPALKALLEKRNQLRDLVATADRSGDVEGILEQVLKNQEEINKAADKLGLKKPEEKA